MFTPQQIEKISFGRATFGGYDIQEVDALLGPLTEDYIALYKENALLKNKMKVLVAKLEEYRQNESSMKEAMENAQRTSDLMVREAEAKRTQMLSEAEAKCTQMLNDANAFAAETVKNADAMMAAEEARLEAAKLLAFNKISEIQEQISICSNALENIKSGNRPARMDKAAAYDYERSKDKTGAMVDEIAANVEAIVGAADNSTPAQDSKQSSADSPTGKFANLQFGRNYNPTNQ